jgi:hypothetical protein
MGGNHTVNWMIKGVKYKNPAVAGLCCLVMLKSFFLFVCFQDTDFNILAFS